MVQMDLLIYYDYAMGESWSGDHYFDRSVLNQYDEEYYTDLVHKLLENKLQTDGDTSTYILLNNQRIKNTSFKIEDQLADIDAVNLYRAPLKTRLIKEKSDMCSSCKETFRKRAVAL